MRQRAPSQPALSFFIIAFLLVAFLIGTAMIGARSARATVSDMKCADSCGSMVLMGTAGNTLTLLAREGLDLVRIGASTTATIGLALGRNLDAMALWINATFWAMLSQLSFIAAGALVLAAVRARRGRR